LWFLTLPKHEVPDIDKYPNSLTEDKDRISPMNGINKQHTAADEGKVPENLWNGTLFLLFRNNPLHEESRAENTLGEKPEYDP
jgi:hypothetical protein